jgi:hypothetical protein
MGLNWENIEQALRAWSCSTMGRTRLCTLVVHHNSSFTNHTGRARIHTMNTPSKQQMIVVAPPNNSTAAHQVLLLHKLDRLLYQKSVRKHMDDLMVTGTEENTTGLRRIQQGRYEIFVKARNKETKAFDWICSQLLPEEDPLMVKKTIVQFALQQACKDPRIGGEGKHYSFDNFSLIVTYNSVKAQAPHIDLLHPNHQFGLILTDHSPGTLVYETQYNVQTVDDIRRAWPDLPDTVAAAMANDTQASAMIRQFGNLLCPVVQQVESLPADQVMSTGTLLSLPGSIIHAGPASHSFRAVLFFSAWPAASAVPQYNPDTQYFASLLCSDLVSVLWRTLAGPADRKYLLTKLACYVNHSRYNNLSHHLQDPVMKNFTNKLGCHKKSFARRRISWSNKISDMQMSLVEEFAASNVALERIDCVHTSTTTAGVEQEQEFESELELERTSLAAAKFSGSWGGDCFYFPFCGLNHDQCGGTQRGRCREVKSGRVVVPVMEKKEFLALKREAKWRRMVGGNGKPCYYFPFCTKSSNECGGTCIGRCREVQVGNVELPKEDGEFKRVKALARKGIFAPG